MKVMNIEYEVQKLQQYISEYVTWAQKENTVQGWEQACRQIQERIKDVEFDCKTVFTVTNPGVFK